jgi:hypothetical protein
VLHAPDSAHYLRTQHTRHDEYEGKTDTVVDAQSTASINGNRRWLCFVWTCHIVSLIILCASMVSLFSVAYSVSVVAHRMIAASDDSDGPSARIVELISHDAIKTLQTKESSSSYWSFIFGNITVDHTNINNGRRRRMQDTAMAIVADNTYSPRVVWPADDRFCSTECRCNGAGLKQYGRNCGLGYTGCDGTEPCDDLDRCCVIHDRCVGVLGMTSCECNSALARCAFCVMQQYGSSQSRINKQRQDQMSCDHIAFAAETIVADILFIFPDCMDGRPWEDRETGGIHE